MVSVLTFFYLLTFTRTGCMIVIMNPVRRMAISTVLVTKANSMISGPFMPVSNFDSRINEVISEMQSRQLSCLSTFPCACRLTWQNSVMITLSRCRPTVSDYVVVPKDLMDKQWPPAHHESYSWTRITFSSIKKIYWINCTTSTRRNWSVKCLKHHFRSLQDSSWKACCSPSSPNQSKGKLPTMLLYTYKAEC